MNVAGPSRVRPPGQLASRGRVESTYEEDLLGLLDHLSLDEMDEIQAFFTLRGRAGNVLSDHDLAMNDLLQQARALAVSNQDRALALRLATGEGVTEQTPVQRAMPVPRQNGNGTNGLAAQRLGNGLQRVAQQPAARVVDDSSQSWGGWLSSVVGWVFGAQPSVPTNVHAPTAAPRPAVSNRPTGHNCVICQDPIHGAEIRAPCGHHYGIDCVTDLFQSATRDESLFPPRCCRQNIPFVQVRPHLSQELVRTFQLKEVEFGTLKRVYCSSPTCSRFLGPISEGVFASKVYTCPAPGCGRRTCGKCRELHTGDWTHNCRPDADAAQVLELGRAAGWARCPGCSQMIELHIGCFHMTCRCRTEFCYLCRARWKTCRCPQWDERRLLAAAEERVDAQLGGRERGARRDVPAQRADLVPAPIPVPVNRARVGVPAPAPIPAQRPVPAPVAPARPLASTRLQPRFVEMQYPPPTPARTATASNSTARPTSTARTGTDHTHEGWEIRKADPTPIPRNAGAVAQTSTSASVLGWRPKMVSKTPSGTSSSASASTSTSASASALMSGWRSSMASNTTSGASGSGLTPASTSFARPKSMHNADPTRSRLIREMMERLREDHECDHKKWRYRSGGGVCQSCGHHLPLYLFRCQGCEMLACNRCRRNRL